MIDDMTRSDKKTDDAKTRDYKYHKKNLIKFYEKIAAQFQHKEDNYGLKKDKVTTIDQPEEIDLFGETDIAPDISVETVTVFKRILNREAVVCDNNEILVLLRKFHCFRYQ